MIAARSIHEQKKNLIIVASSCTVVAKVHASNILSTNKTLQQNVCLLKLFNYIRDASKKITRDTFGNNNGELL
jgi:hypothetical protein